MTENIVQLAYQQTDIEKINDFIRELNSRYQLFLNELLVFYAQAPIRLTEQIVLNGAEPVVKKRTTKLRPEKVSPKEYQGFTEVDNELLKDYPLYTPSTLHIEKTDFYLNRQYGFMDSIHELLEDLYKMEDSEDSCDKSSDFVMLKHQRIVQTYLNSYTPYRGLLLYHGLGSGKTCSSIGILEGMKHDKKIYILTPASLQENYRTQMTFCGDNLFKTKHHWVKVKEDSNAVFELYKQYLFLDNDKRLLDGYLKKYKMIWLIQEGTPNYDTLDNPSKQQIQELIRLLITMKYNFINYNGINKKSWEKLKKTQSNPFHNSVVVIDEAHNFIGKVNNKLMAGKTSVSTELYDSLMEAQNTKVVLLSGTPYINSPSELGVMINLISGYTIEYEVRLTKKYDIKTLRGKLKELEMYNLIEYKFDTIFIVRNPYGFKTTETGEVHYEKPGLYEDVDFEGTIRASLQKSSIPIQKILIKKYKKIPDDEKEFNTLFVKREGDRRIINNKDFFQTRIAGLISYLGDKTSLMPRLEPMSTEIIPMSSHQRKEYAAYKARESSGKKTQKDGSYKVFTRAACNFVFDDKIKRPFPDINKIKTENDFDYTSVVNRLKQADAVEEDGDPVQENEDYNTQIVNFVKNVYKHRSTLLYNELKKMVTEAFERPPDEMEYGLKKYSPKFHKILENILADQNTCHLFYSSFRRIEGIEMMRQLLKYQGYRELVVFKNSAGFYDLKLEGYYKDYNEMRVFALYTGTEENEVKEIIRNIYNSNLSKLTNTMLARLKDLYPEEPDNLHGGLIQLLMITASGAEGIDLQNVRYVHITEPYWHNVRLEQVIGRARRICSHNRLPLEERTVKVFLYISSLKEMEKKELSTDEFLFNIMEEKRVLSESFLNTLKESAIDCNPSTQKCFKFPVGPKSKNAFALDYKKEAIKPQSKNLNFVDMELMYQGVMQKVKVDTRQKPNKVYIETNGKLREIGLLVGDKIE